MTASLARQQPATTNDPAALLRGAIDIHVHSDPDNVPRSIDGLDAATMARASGMRGIVLKNHYDPTAGLAFLARNYTNKEIARALDVGPTTIKWHLRNLFGKLNVGSRRHAVQRARMLQLVEPEPLMQ